MDSCVVSSAACCKFVWGFVSADLPEMYVLDHTKSYPTVRSSIRSRDCMASSEALPFAAKLNWPTFVDHRVKLCSLFERATEEVKTRLRLAELE